MAQQTLLGGDGVTGENGATHNSKANANFTELYSSTAAAAAAAAAANSNLSTHISDPSAAHASTAISYDPTGSGLSSTEVQGAIDEIAGAAGVGSATTTAEGIAELAIDAEVIAGTDTVRIVTPSGLNAKLRITRNVTGADSIVQTDDNGLIIFNSASPFNFTLNQITASSKVSFINIGAGVVTFIAGSGVTITGGPTIAAASGTSYPTAIVFYHTLTTPRVITGSAYVVGPSSAIDGQPVLYDGTTGKLIKTGDVPLSGIVPSSAASKLLGRQSGSAGDWQEITLGTNLTMTGTTLDAAGGGGGAVSSVDGATGAVLLETLSAVALSGSNLTLAWASRQNQNFDLTTTLAGNATIIFSGSNRVTGKLFLRVTGTIVLTFPANTYMDLYEKSVGRWDTTGTRQLQLIGVTASPFMLQFEIDALGNTLVYVSNKMVTS